MEAQQILHQQLLDDLESTAPPDTPLCERGQAGQGRAGSTRRCCVCEDGTLAWLPGARLDTLG